MGLVVQKYGGTSVGSVERIRKIARRVAEARRNGDELLLVVSAMAGETDRRLQMAPQVTPQPDHRELDQLLVTGEQVSCALVAMALHEQGVPARSFTGTQVRIRTDSSFSKARIHSIDDQRLRDELRQGKVAVVAGFQGVDDHGNVTTLGRGGSDTSAVALAAALKADRCEIYTDVDGIYTADPNVCPGARKLSEISYDEILELASLGAKVLQIRSVAFAKKFGVPLEVRSSFRNVPGTRVVERRSSMEKVMISGVTFNRDEARISLRGVPDRPGIAAQIFKPLGDHDITVDMIIQNSSAEGYTDVTFTVPKRDLRRARKLAEEVASGIHASEVVTDDRIAKVSIVGVGIRDHSWIASRMFDTLAKEGINILMISTSEIKISCVVREEFAERAVRALHRVFVEEMMK
jgi:aspartate kinase